MTHSPYRIRQSDVSRVLKGVKNAGIYIGRVEINFSGHIIISTSKQIEALTSPLDNWKAEHEAKFKRHP